MACIQYLMLTEIYIVALLADEDLAPDGYFFCNLPVS